MEETMADETQPTAKAPVTLRGSAENLHIYHLHILLIHKEEGTAGEKSGRLLKRCKQNASRLAMAGKAAIPEFC